MVRVSRGVPGGITVITVRPLVFRFKELGTTKGGRVRSDGSVKPTPRAAVRTQQFVQPFTR
jgi:hypothetical protein